MNDLADPSADHPSLPDVDGRALVRHKSLPEVDVRALDRPAPAPEVDAEALTRPPVLPEPPKSRRRRVVIGLAAAVAVVVAGGGVWWNRQVTSNPRLEFTGALNVYRDAEFTDLSGIVRREGRGFSDVDEVEAAFVPNRRLFASVGLYNGGAHDVRIEAALPGSMYSWGFDRMSLTTDPFGGYNGQWTPFQPFTLHRGDTRTVRLEFRLADCDPAPEAGGYSVLRQLRLRYHVLGITRTAGVPFANGTIALQTGGDCRTPIVD